MARGASNDITTRKARVVKQLAAQCYLRGNKVFGWFNRRYGLSAAGLAERGGSDQANQSDHPRPGHDYRTREKMNNEGNRRLVPAFSWMHLVF